MNKGGIIMKNINILQTVGIDLADTSHDLCKALKQHKATSLLLIVMIVLSLAACSRRSESSDADAHTYEGAGPRPEGTTTGDTNVPHAIPDTGQEVDIHLIDRTQFYGETLTIYAVSRFSNNIAVFADEFMRQNPGITIEIITFGHDMTRARRDVNTVLENIAAQEAPHVAPPVLIESTLVNTHYTHHFENWGPFIDATPDINNYNFFMNVINAMTLDGYLYEFPITFLYSMVAANNTIPGLVHAMEMYEDGITMYRLLGLMRNFNTTRFHPDVPDQPMYFLHNFDVGYGFEYLHDSFNSETDVSEFNNQRFIDFLNHAREATYPGKVFDEDYAPDFPTMASPDWAFTIWRYFFINVGAMDYHGVMAFRRDDLRTYFSGATPIVSEQGELIITPAATYVLSTHATTIQQALAWDFIQFLSSEEGARAVYLDIGILLRAPMMHINRETARFIFRADWSTISNFCELTFILTGTTDGDMAIPVMYDWIDTLGNMPMVLAQTWPDAVRLVLQDFHNGAISAADTAVLIQDLIEFEMAGT